MRIKIAGPFDDPTGYGEVARQIAFALHHLGVDVLAQSRNWGCTRIGLSPELQELLKQLKEKEGNCDCYLNVSVPYFFRATENKPSAGLTMSEVDGIPGKWAELCNQMDLVFVPSRFNMETFQKSGVSPAKLRCLPLGIDSELFTPIGEKYRLEAANSLFTFLSVGEWSPRKGFETLIRAFVQEFTRRDNVCLVLRCQCNGSDYDPNGRHIKNQIAKLVEAERKLLPPPVILVPQTLHAQEMPALYRLAHCFVLPTRGEGWSIPAFEALACEVPVIITNWSAYLDYLNNDNAYLIDVESLEPVPGFGIATDEIYVGHKFAKPSTGHLRYLMRHVYTHRQEAKEKAVKGRNMVKELTWTTTCEKMIGYFSELLTEPRKS